MKKRRRGPSECVQCYIWKLPLFQPPLYIVFQKTMAPIDMKIPIPTPAFTAPPPYGLEEAADPVADAEAAGAEVDGVMLGPGPAVIMSPFPPGYVAPAAAMKS